MRIQNNNYTVTCKKSKNKINRNLKKLLTNLQKDSIISLAIEKMYAPLAQLVEHLTLNQGVQGSSP